ncbi:MAG: alanine dehydrogenase [Firmicutes bacterium]|nr:alanine dehydrogenase [Bacillota bacterium]
MIIGVPKEIKTDEARVALTPAGAATLAAAGHRVLVETGAGVGSGFEDDDYRAAGATLVGDKRKLFDDADMIIKVKEPLPPEYDLFHEGQVLFTYLHLAPDREQTLALLKAKIIAVAYETVEVNGSLPLLTPMSEIAGRMATQIGAHFLEKPQGGRGVLLGGVPGVPPGEVVVIGGGTVGLNAARIALGMGAHVTILDINPDRLRQIDDLYGGRIVTLASNSYSVAEAVAKADLLVGAVLIPGARAPKIVTEEMVKRMKPGSVIVDVAIDQGGCVETIDRVTTHRDPVYVKHGVVHYSVANMPGAVARTSTLALTNATLPYAVKLASDPLGAIRNVKGLDKGVNVFKGKLTIEAVAQAHGLEYTPLEQAMG